LKRKKNIIIEKYNNNLIHAVYSSYNNLPEPKGQMLLIIKPPTFANGLWGPVLQLAINSGKFIFPRTHSFDSLGDWVCLDQMHLEKILDHSNSSASDPDNGGVTGIILPLLHVAPQPQQLQSIVSYKRGKKSCFTQTVGSSRLVKSKSR
jgi:hypothetical protein